MKKERASSVAEAERLQCGTIVRGVTKGASFYTLQLNDEGHWNQMGSEDWWEHSALFPFFDYLHIVYQPNERA